MKTKIIRCENSTVTDFYLDVIDEACKSIDSDAEITITARYKDCLNAKLRGEKTVMWSQGIAPEEFAMRYNKPIKLFAVDRMAKMAVKKADFMFFVSDYMREHYEKKYKLKFDPKRYYVMPCFNTEIHEEAFLAPGKYENNIFTYIGSMEAWQGVDHILDVYREIEEKGLVNEPKLIVYTSEQKEAKEKIERKHIKNYQIDFCPNDKLNQALSGVKYGFILRDDNEVNRVSTPTKISTYLSCGVIPIYSDCLRSFHQIASNMEYVIEENELNAKIGNQRFEQADTTSVLNEYKQVFGDYYSKQSHIANIKVSLGKYLNSLGKKK